MVHHQIRLPNRTPAARLARHSRRRSHLNLRPNRLRKNSRRILSLHRPTPPPGYRRQPRALHSSRLRLAPQSPLQRHPEEPQRPTSRDPQSRPNSRPSLHRNPHRSPHWRHPPQRTRRHAPQPAPYPCHHPRISLHPAHSRQVPRTPPPSPHRHRRRNPRHRRRQARSPPSPHPRAPRRPRHR